MFADSVLLQASFADMSQITLSVDQRVSAFISPVSTPMSILPDGRNESSLSSRTLATNRCLRLQAATGSRRSKGIAMTSVNSSTATVRRIRSAEEFRNSLSASGSSHLTVIAFTAQDCRACQYARRAYARAAADLGATAATELSRNPSASTTGVDFFELDVGAPALKDICRTLGVEAVPMWHVYGGNDRGQLFELHRVVGPRSVGLLKQSVEQLVRNGIDLDDYEEDTSSHPPNQNLVQGTDNPRRVDPPAKRWWWF